MNTQEYSQYTVIHPMKGTMDRPVVMVPLLVYTDDTSGNRSKKWNKFDQWCFLLAGLPRSMNAQMHNIHFVTCSNQASATDMMGPIVADLKCLEEGIPAYDAYLQREIVLVAPVIAFLCDNRRHSELLNHVGGRANKYCRMCMVCVIHYGTCTFSTIASYYTIKMSLNHCFLRTSRQTEPLPQLKLL